jgi:hypothetical protein
VPDAKISPQGQEQNKMETTQTSKISKRKAALRLTSNTVQKLMDAGKIKAANLNDGLLAFYNGKKKNQVWWTLE